MVWFHLAALDRDHCLMLLLFHRWEPNSGGAAWLQGRAERQLQVPSLLVPAQLTATSW